MAAACFHDCAILLDTEGVVTHTVLTRTLREREKEVEHWGKKELGDGENKYNGKNVCLCVRASVPRKTEAHVIVYVCERE